MRWTIERATLDDAERVETFMLTIPEFAGTVSVGVERSVWKWLFARDGRVGDAYLAQDAAGKVVGHYGVAPLPYSADGQRVMAGLLCKLAIAEDYRHTPLFMRLAMQVLKAQSREDSELSFSLGLVNRPGILQFHLAFGLTPIGDVPVYAKPMNLERVARQLLPARLYNMVRLPTLAASHIGRSASRLRATRFTKQVTITPISAFTEEFDTVSRFLSRYRYHAMRTASSLTHRFFAGPPRGYQVFRVDGPSGLAGYFVLRRMPMKEFDALAIVDVCLDPAVPQASSAVMKFVDVLALDLGVDLVSALAGSPDLRRLMRHNLYFKSPERFTLVVQSPRRAGLVRSNSPTTLIAPSRISDWYVTWHDHDYV